MAIPDFQTLMLPLLELAGNGREWGIGDAVERLAEKFQLNEEERRQMLPSGAQATFDNRVHWARSYLKQAGLLVNPGRGVFQISNRGSDVLQKHPVRIDVPFLTQFEEFKAFNGRRTKGESTATPDSSVAAESETPHEILERSFERLFRELSAEILSAVQKLSPDRFERLVVRLLVAMGYGGTLTDAGRAVGGSGDEGIDGIIKEDRLGLDVIYVQAKRWTGPVGRPEIQKFAGALQGQRARKGVFITTSEFSDAALQFVERIDLRIVLIDGDYLSRLLIDYDLGVTPVTSYSVKRLDSDFFAEF